MNGEPDITLTLPVPPSANRMWRVGNGRTYKSAAYLTWQTHAGYVAALGAAGDRIEGAYALGLTLPKTRMDPDNLIKPINDLMQQVRIVANDRHMRRLSLDLDEARTDILVRLWALPTPEKKRKRA